MEALCIPFWIVGFVLARILVGSSESWKDLSFAHWSVLPVLILGYIAITLLMIFTPAVIVWGLGFVPAAIDVDPTKWTMFGDMTDFEFRGDRIPTYWLRVACASAVITSFWGAIVTAFAYRQPAPFVYLFHPVTENGVRAISMYLGVITVLVVGPFALLLIFALKFMS